MASEANWNGDHHASPYAPAMAGSKWRRRVTVVPRLFIREVADFLNQLKKLGQEDPRRVIHSFKVGFAITLVSCMFYFIDAMYESFGSSSIWAVFSVIVSLEFSMGATLAKGFNRGLATLSGGVLGVATISVTSSAGKTGEQILTGIVLLVIATGATFLRFDPKVKARFDYGFLVFIMTYVMIALSSFRERNALEVAQKRLLTIVIGAVIALVVCVVFPIWAGDDIHDLATQNIETLGVFLEGFGDEYFKRSEGLVGSYQSSLPDYTSVINSKQNEENLVNFARYEPRHGRYKYRHPWKQYLLIGNLTRQVAYRIDALNGLLYSSTAPPEIKRKLEEPCTKMSKETGQALKELAVALSNMVPPTSAEPHINNSKTGATNLSAKLSSELQEGTNLREAMPVVEVASLLVDVVSCTERLAESIERLSTLPKFKNTDPNKVAPASISQRDPPV